MNKFFKVLVWVIILGAVCFGIYSVLPEYPKSFVKSFVQPVVSKEAKTRIEQVKSLNNQDVNATYKDILERYTNTSCWVYDKNASSGAEIVTFYGKGASINIKDVPKHEDRLYTSCAVKFTFEITGNSVTITAEIDNQPQDEVIRDVMIKQLYNGKN